MKIKNVFVPFVLLLCVGVGILLGDVLHASDTVVLGRSAMTKNKIHRLLDLINKEYVDSINGDSIVDLTVNKIMSQLDPHSVYLPAEEQNDAEESMQGDFVGVGISYYVIRDTVTVLETTKGGPAEKAGLKTGDRILAIDKISLVNKKLKSDSLSANFRGEIGSKAIVTIKRKSNKKIEKVTLTRDVIPLESVDAALMINPTLGYIRINRFALTTNQEFQKQLQNLKKHGLKDLVIDLRGNGGGIMDQAIEIADTFLPENKLIVFTKDKNNNIEKSYATAKGNLQEGKVWVLIDENTASASEILAGALQDNDRATIVGRRSFGKGLVQRETVFEDGSAVRLTIARYFTPTGRSIQKTYVRGHSEEYLNEDYNRMFEGEWYHKDSIKVDKKLQFKTPKGKIVYGGGGIIPDVFVPIEIEKGDENGYYLPDSGYLPRFVFEVLDKRKENFDYKNKAAFLDNTSKMNWIALLEKYIRKEGVSLHLDKSKTYIGKLIKAEFIKQLFGEAESQKYLLENDKMMQSIK